MQGSFWSLLPFLIVIPLAMLTRQVLVGLLAGLLVGAYIKKWTWLGGIELAVHYVVEEVTLPNNLRLLLFLYGFGAFIGLVRVTGGVSGFSRWMNSRIRSARSAFIVTWLSSLATFMAPDFRIITVGPVMKEVFQRLKIARSKVAFIIDATSTPLIALIPIGTAFVGYMVGLIADSAYHQGLSITPYQVFLQSIPFNFFSILMLVYTFYLTFFKGKSERSAVDPKDCPSSIRTPFRTSPQVGYFKELCKQDKEVTEKKITATSSEHEPDSDFPDPIEIVSESAAPKAIHLIVPLSLLLGFTFFLTWWDGHTKTLSFWGALTKADAGKAMLEAVFITLVLSFIWYVLYRQPIERVLFGFLQGGNEMMGVNVLLVLVWALTAVSADLGFITYTKTWIEHLVPSLWLAPALFLVGCLISYVVGSSFGTWAVLMPLGFSLAAGTHTSLPLIIGAIFASGSFGGFASPLSDNTVAAATVMKLPLMKYAHQKLMASLIVVAASTILYAVMGWVMSS